MKLLSRLFTWANYALLFLSREYCNGNLFPHKDTFNDLLRIKYCLSSISDNCQEIVRGGMLLHAIALFFRNINKNRRKSCNIQWWKCAFFLSILFTLLPSHCFLDTLFWINTSSTQKYILEITYQMHFFIGFLSTLIAK